MQVDTASELSLEPRNRAVAMRPGESSDADAKDSRTVTKACQEVAKDSIYPWQAHYLAWAAVQPLMEAAKQLPADQQSHPLAANRGEGSESVGHEHAAVFGAASDASASGPARAESPASFEFEGPAAQGRKQAAEHQFSVTGAPSPKPIAARALSESLCQIAINHFGIEALVRLEAFKLRRVSDLRDIVNRLSRAGLLPPIVVVFHQASDESIEFARLYPDAIRRQLIPAGYTGVGWADALDGLRLWPWNRVAGLSHLPPRTRERFWEMATQRSGHGSLTTIAALAWLAALLPVAWWMYDALYRTFPNTLLAFVIAATLWLGPSIAIVLYSWRMTRRALEEVVLEQRPNDPLPFCLRCGYPLMPDATPFGDDGEPIDQAPPPRACPECGAAVASTLGA